MGKSKSHPCKHPLKAQRTNEAGIWCHKCKTQIFKVEDVVGPDDPCPEPVKIEAEVDLGV